MIRFKSLLLTAALLAAATVLFANKAEAHPHGLRGGSFLGIAGSQQVQKELKLSEEEVKKVKELGDKLGKEMREQFGKLREIEDRQKRREKMTELRKGFDEKVRSGVRKIVSGEQMRRIYQIRLQIRGDLYGLNNKWIAGRLKLSDDVKKKAAELDKSTKDEMYKLYTGLRDLKEEERRKKYAEIREKGAKLRADADKKALEMLNDEQKEQLQKFKGDEFKIEE